MRIQKFIKLLSPDIKKMPIRVAQNVSFNQTPKPQTINQTVRLACPAFLIVNRLSNKPCGTYIDSDSECRTRWHTTYSVNQPARIS